jgi:hypothetical protein
LTTQFPDFTKLSEFPFVEQIDGESDWKETGNPLEDVAERTRDLLPNEALEGVANETV